MRAKTCEIREENERLRAAISRITKNHQSLEMQFIQQEQAKNPTNESNSPNSGLVVKGQDLVVLSLGTTSSSTETKKKEEMKRSNHVDQMTANRLTLGLQIENCSSTVQSETISPSSLSIENSMSLEELKEEEAAVIMPMSEAGKHPMRSEDDDEAPAYSHVRKRARVSVRARCEAPTVRTYTVSNSLHA